MGRFDDELAKGIEAEDNFQDAAERVYGWKCMRALDKHGRAGQGPRFGDLIAPDLLAAKDGRTWWVDVKRKFGCGGYNGQRRTGLDARCWEDYRKVREISGLEVALVFWHDSTLITQGRDRLKFPEERGIWWCWIDHFDATKNGNPGRVNAGCIEGKRVLFADLDSLTKLDV